ncbi:hypothetical protein MTQ10_25060 [Streptomyces sp. XM83C]|nr:hypothetical protein [Streptomyces sp. XM83C]MCK1822778.1 hypothetical protein [Streptomyces sp. XM83C]
MQGRHVLQVAGRYQGRRRVAHHRQQDLGEGSGVAAGQVRQCQDRHPGQAQRETGHAACPEVFPGAEEAGQDHADDRDARDQQARRRRGQMAFGIRQREPRADDLDAGERQHRTPVRGDGPAQAALA